MRVCLSCGFPAGARVRKLGGQSVPRFPRERLLRNHPPVKINTTEIQTDFCVIGGGLTGVCAAISAARHGLRVVLVQNRSILGGNSSSEVKMHIVGADRHGTNPGARETGLLEEFRLEDAFRNPHRSFALWDLLLYEKVMAEPNIRLLLDTECLGCTLETAGGKPRIASVNALRNVTEDAFEIRARFFADCSGDGRLGREAGAAFRMGREAQSEFGESLAPENADHLTLGNSILFTAHKESSPQAFVRPGWVRQFRREDFEFRPIASYEYGYWWSEWGGTLHTIKDFDCFRHECLRIALGVWDYIKNSGDHPEASHYALDWVGAIPGKRESRRFLGTHVLTQQEVMGGAVFDDQVAYGGWWVDLHPPEGIDAVKEEPCVQLHFPNLFGIPLRSLYSRNIANLFFAGRNASATHVAFASTRVMGTCSVMGQAIGTATACFAAKGASAIEEAATPEALRAIQQTLLKDDAFLPGIRNEDSADLARRACCAASSTEGGWAASNVLSGVTRELNPVWGSWADPAPNHWASQSLPAWIDLELPEPAGIAQIHLTFDSGLQRELILTPSDSITAKTIRGAQPELVRDYTIYLDQTPVLSVKGNYLRKRVHTLAAPVTARRVRIEVQATHGAKNARIFEVRLYAKP